MEIALFESGYYYDNPDIVRVFSTIERAIDNIPPEYEKKETYMELYYENQKHARWLSITIYKVEE